MTLETWWLYLGAVVLIACTPGPNVLYVTTRSIRFGFGAAMTGMAGCLLALAVMLAGSIAGVSAFMLAVPTAFEVLKYAGAAYLIFLGIQMWRAPVDFEPLATASPRGTASRVALFRGGFLVGISNPKLLIFAAAFFPQFITPSAPWAPQFALLVATFLAVGVILLRDLCAVGPPARDPSHAGRVATAIQPRERCDFCGIRRRTASLPAVVLPASPSPV